MALTVNNTPGKQFSPGEKVTYAGLNLLGQPTFSITGTVDESDLQSGSVTSSKTKPGPHFYAAGTLTGSIYAVPLNPALAAYADGVTIYVKLDSGSPADAQLNVNTLGDRKIYTLNDTPIKAGQLRVNQVVGFRYNSNLDGGTGGFHLIEPTAYSDMSFLSSTGSNGAYVLTFPNTMPTQAQLDGVVIHFIANHNQEANTATLDVGPGAVNIKYWNNLNVPTRSIRENQVVSVIYSSTLAGYIMVSPMGRPDVFHAIDGGSTDSYAITPVPSPAAYFDGMNVLFKANTANSEAATLNVNTLGAIDLRKEKDQPLETGDIKAGQYVQAVYDGTNFQVLNSSGGGAGGQVAAWGKVDLDPTTGLVAVEITSVDLIDDEITVTAHGIPNATSLDDVQIIFFSAGGEDPPAPLSTNVAYYAYRVDNDTLSVHTSPQGAIDGTTDQVVLVDAGSTTDMNYFPMLGRFNVDGIRQHSTGAALDNGDFTVYWKNSFSSGNYVVQFTAKGTTPGECIAACIAEEDADLVNQTQMRIENMAGTSRNPDGLHVVAYGS